MATIERSGLSLQARDVSGQKMVHVNDVPPHASVGELVHGLVSKMSLPHNDVEGRPLNYHARLEREGRHLRASETVGDVLDEQDEIVLQPHIVAGGC